MRRRRLDANGWTQTAGRVWPASGGVFSRLPASISSLLKRYGSDKVSPMSPANPVRDNSPATSMGFHTTHWTIVSAARDKDGTAAQEALANLCLTYWYP